MIKGTRAIRRVPFPLVNVPGPMLPDMPELAEQRAADAVAFGEQSTTIEVGLRVLSGEQLADVLEHARAFAIKRGLENPRDSDPLYELGKRIYTLLYGCVDPDSDPKAPTPFFASAEEIEKSEHIGGDGILFLSEQHETWQDMCSSQALRLTPEQLMALAETAAGSKTTDFLELMRPGLRWIFVRTLAALWLSSLERSSTSTTASESDGDSSTKASE